MSITTDIKGDIQFVTEPRIAVLEIGRHDCCRTLRKLLAITVTTYLRACNSEFLHAIQTLYPLIIPCTCQYPEPLEIDGQSKGSEHQLGDNR
jgi:hypothetical protein